MKQLYRATLIALLSCGLFSCGEDKNGCEDYTGPELKKNNNGTGCYYEANGSVHGFTDPEFCKCAK